MESAGPRTAVVVGAGPAGLTAAYELLERTDYRPIVLEASDVVGGLSRTVKHRGNRMDIGGHRFFSKSDRVMDWWFNFLPMQSVPHPELTIFYQGRSRTVPAPGSGPDPSKDERVMLVRPRASRIYFLRKLFPYPITLSLATLLKLGPWRSMKIFFSYLRICLFPPRKIENLEEFFISRFGRQLYETFFKSYTEKVWGKRCTEISAEWGAQRVKGLSISRAIGHALAKLWPFRRRRVETSLIEQFLYPKYGPGQMWETVAAEVERRGGRILTGRRAVGLTLENGRVVGVDVEETSTGRRETLKADLVFSTLPVKELLRSMSPPAPPEIRAIAEGLEYRDFVTVGLSLPKLAVGSVGDAGTIRDNWIYIHEPSVDAGRLQIFNNWSPWLVKDPARAWVGVEYFCNEGDRLWAQSDADMIAQTMRELRTIGLVDGVEPEDAVVVRMPKAYPAYTGSYGRFGELRAWLDGIENLWLIGRNGMHRYNNQDHSMLAAMTAVDNLAAGRRDRSNLWEVNAEEDYHESKK
jgi:protoporphyrinogen oxidase